MFGGKSDRVTCRITASRMTPYTARPSIDGWERELISSRDPIGPTFRLEHRHHPPPALYCPYERRIQLDHPILGY